jgi:hypothetical protein
MTRISHPMTIVDLAGTPPLQLQVGREFQGEGFFDSNENCWTANLNDLAYLRKLLFSVLRRFQFQRPNTRVKPGYVSWSVGTEERNFTMGVGIVAAENGDYAVFDFGRRFYISLEQVQDLHKTVTELKAIQAEKRHFKERCEPGRPQRSFVEQWGDSTDRRYGDY